MIINVNKPMNWTSFDVVAKLRGVLGIKKIGHAGTLDPLAEGVLLILTEKDTKKQNDLMKLEKEYLAEVAFGARSPTYDLEGPVEAFQQINTDKEELKSLQDRLTKILPKYVGEIRQKVPPYSAVKVNGKRLYDKARPGTIEPEEIPVKTVNIYSIEIEAFEVKQLLIPEPVLLPVVTLRVKCGSGTYIRSLAHDLGEDLETGAVLASLIRTKVGEYSVKDAKRLEEIIAA